MKFRHRFLTIQEYVIVPGVVHIVIDYVTPSSSLAKKQYNIFVNSFKRSFVKDDRHSVLGRIAQYWQLENEVSDDIDVAFENDIWQGLIDAPNGNSTFNERHLWLCSNNILNFSCFINTKLQCLYIRGMEEVIEELCSRVPFKNRHCMRQFLESHLIEETPCLWPIRLYENKKTL